MSCCQILASTFSTAVRGIVGWALSVISSQCRQSSTSYCLPYLLPERLVVLVYLSLIWQQERWWLGKRWVVALDLINKIPAHHSLNQLKMLMPGPDDSSLQTEKAASINSLKSLASVYQNDSVPFFDAKMGVHLSYRITLQYTVSQYEYMRQYEQKPLFREAGCHSAMIDPIYLYHIHIAESWTFMGIRGF